MAITDRDPLTGAAIIAETSATTPGADMTAVAKEAMLAGTRYIGTTPERTAFKFPRVGLLWFDTTLGYELIYTAAGWKQNGVIRSQIAVPNGYAATTNSLTKDGDNIVEALYVVGRAAESGLGVLLGTVPANFRIAAGTPFAAAANGGGLPSGAVLQFEADGRIILYATGGANKTFSVIARYRAA